MILSPGSPGQTEFGLQLFQSLFPQKAPVASVLSRNFGHCCPSQTSRKPHPLLPSLAQNLPQMTRRLRPAASPEEILTRKIFFRPLDEHPPQRPYCAPNFRTVEREPEVLCPSERIVGPRLPHAVTLPRAVHPLARQPLQSLRHQKHHPTGVPMPRRRPEARRRRRRPTPTPCRA